jgi:GNAT superfamily N-acetyltransferase
VKVPARFKVGIARYTPADADDLLAFQLRTFGPGVRQVDAARAAWLFDRNPCRTDDETRDMWVCRRDGAIVGQQAEIPFDLYAGPHHRRAAWAVDLMVDDAWRLRGVGPALVSTQLDHRPIVAGLNLSDKGHATYARGGWTDLGIVPVYLRALDLGRAGRLGPLPGRVARLSPVAGPALRAADRAAHAVLRAAGARLVPIARFDERADAVWRHASPHYPVLALRDLATLAWRIDDRPDRDRMQRYYLVARGQAVGYVVLRPAGTAAAPTAVIVDYLAAPRWVAPLLVAAGGVARRQGAVAMSVKTRNEPADRHLRAAGFVRRERGTDEPVRFMVRCSDPVVSPLVEEPANWFVTSADSDLEYGMTPAGRTDVASSITTSADLAPPDTAPPDTALPDRAPAPEAPADQSETS